MRDTIIFSGQSNTFGLGLEWEIDPELNSEEYLQKGIKMPIPRLPHYQTYWKEYRWTTIVCDKLGYKQHNLLDSENKPDKTKIQIGANGIETLYYLIKNKNKIKDLLSKTKYVILETPYIRWYDEKLHGSIDGYKYPSTVMEIIELINNPKSDINVVRNALQWINDIDPNVYTLEIYKKLNYLTDFYPEIKFLILPWHSDETGITASKHFKNFIINIKENNENYKDANDFLEKNKIKVWHKAKAFNGDYEFNYKDEHASIEGHNRIAKIVIDYIQKLELNITDEADEFKTKFL